VRLLLDTHTLVWALSGSRSLPASIRKMLADPRNAVFVSVVSLFEIATKRAASGGRLPELGADDALSLASRTGFALLSLEPEHAVAVETFAPFHGDPFDRLLLAQAQIEGFQLVTHDEAIAAYDARTILF
jgi:PIN domain nuclease of toxin-antitoxin system